VLRGHGPRPVVLVYTHGSFIKALRGKGKTSCHASEAIHGLQMFNIDVQSAENDPPCKFFSRADQLMIFNDNYDLTPETPKEVESCKSSIEDFLQAQIASERAQTTREKLRWRLWLCIAYIGLALGAMVNLKWTCLFAIAWLELAIESC
jgi:hypothetical protein